MFTHILFSRQEQEQQQQQRQANKKEKEKEQEQEQEQKIYSTATVWISGGNRLTLYIPNGLAKKYRMGKLCKVVL
jgi:hypothetical protein